jgi:heptosyltransferase II
MVHCPNWVGDLVMATPALRTVRENNPDAHIALLVRPQIRQVIEGLPYYDEIIEYDSTTRDRSLMRKLAASRRLRTRRFSRAFILPNSFGSAALAFLAAIPQRVGYRTNGRGFMLTASIPGPQQNGKAVPIPMVDRYLELCTRLNYVVSSRRIELALSEGTREHADRLYRERGISRTKPLVSFIPGASFGSSKCWPAERFAEVGDALVERYGVQVLVLPGPGEEEIASRIESAMRQRSFNFVHRIVPLELLKALISDSALVVTNDTGPRHFAAAFGVPAIVIMGPTDPRYTDYDRQGMGALRVFREAVECGPCHLKVCPTDHRCMRNITAGPVIAACEEFLQKGH